MNQQKVDAVADISKKFENAKGIYFTDCLGLNVEDMTALRKDCYREQVEFRVVKNTLARLSAKKAGFEGIEEIFEGPTAIAFSYDDPVSPARVLRDFKKSHELPELKGFIFEGEVMDKSSFTEVANLPTREQLLGRLANGLSSPMAKLVLALRGPLANFVNILNRLRNERTISENQEEDENG